MEQDSQPTTTLTSASTKAARPGSCLSKDINRGLIMCLDTASRLPKSKPNEESKYLDDRRANGENDAFTIQARRYRLSYTSLRLPCHEVLTGAGSPLVMIRIARRPWSSSIAEKEGSTRTLRLNQLTPLKYTEYTLSQVKLSYVTSYRATNVCR